MKVGRTKQEKVRGVEEHTKRDEVGIDVLGYSFFFQIIACVKTTGVTSEQILGFIHCRQYVDGRVRETKATQIISLLGCQFHLSTTPLIVKS